MGGYEVRYINQPRIGADPEDDPFHAGDISVLESEIGQKGDQGRTQIIKPPVHRRSPHVEFIFPVCRVIPGLRGRGLFRGIAL